MTLSPSAVLALSRPQIDGLCLLGSAGHAAPLGLTTLKALARRGLIRFPQGKPLGAFTITPLGHAVLRVIDLEEESRWL